MSRGLMSRRALLTMGGTAVAGAVLLPAIAARAATSTGEIVVANGETVTLTETTRCRRVSIAEGGKLAAPDGYILSMTVNGTETGSVLESTYATATTIAPGSWSGDIVVTVAKVNLVPMFGETFGLRQALYVDSSGIEEAYSVLSAVSGGRYDDSGARAIRLLSTGEAFDGVYVAGGDYELTSPLIRFDGNGRLDFAGYGAGIVGSGTSTRLVIDGADIRSRGMVRSGVIVTGGASVIVKNSRISTRDGIPPSDYVPSLGPDMMSVPWMLGLSGNVRATVLLGNESRATYVNSSVTSENWGVLSTDSDSEAHLTGIACQARITGTDGYGTYADGSAIDRFLGTEFYNVTYGAISTGGSVYYGDSTRSAVAAANNSLDLRLSGAELAAIPVRPCVVESRRFGVMFVQGNGGSADITGGTRFATGETTFVVKSVGATINVDGSQGATVTTGNGALMQLMNTDDPGSFAGVYTDPAYTDPIPSKDPGFSLTTVHNTDTVANFTGIELNGSFYNGMRDGKNLVLTFTRSRVAGVISATLCRHHVEKIDASLYRQINEVSNTVHEPVNNGVLLTLGSGSRWTVTGTSYLSVLTLASDAALAAPPGNTVTMTLDGTVTAIQPGTTYTGIIELTVT